MAFYSLFIYKFSISNIRGGKGGFIIPWFRRGLQIFNHFVVLLLLNLDL
jgi:hypothetical protein